MKHKTSIKIILDSFFLALLVLPFLAFAAGLVPCIDNCNLCQFIVLVNNVVEFLLTILILPACVIALIIAGILLLTATGDPTKIEKGKDIFKYAVMGIIISFGAWVIINTLLGKILNTGYLPWNDFPCCGVNCVPVI